jgi:hypothetical protein
VGRLPAALYTLVEGLEKLTANYKLPDVYRALHYVAVETALLRRGLRAAVGEAPKGGAAGLLVALARRALRGPLSDIITWMDRKLREDTPFVVSEGSVEELAKELRGSVTRRVDKVVAHDGLSLLELAACAAYLRQVGIQAVVADVVFVNPPGVTRYVSAQAPPGYRQSLAGVSQMLAQKLNAREHERSWYVDWVVHNYGEGGWVSFIEHLDVEFIAKRLAAAATNGCVLVFSDHGYDVVFSEERGLYVVHGYKLKEADRERVVLPLSRFSFILVAFPASVG